MSMSASCTRNGPGSWCRPVSCLLLPLGSVMLWLKTAQKRMSITYQCWEDFAKAIAREHA